MGTTQTPPDASGVSQSPPIDPNHPCILVGHIVDNANEPYKLRADPTKPDAYIVIQRKEKREPKPYGQDGKKYLQLDPKEEIVLQAPWLKGPIANKLSMEALEILVEAARPTTIVPTTDKTLCYVCSGPPAA